QCCQHGDRGNFLLRILRAASHPYDTEYPAGRVADFLPDEYRARSGRDRSDREEKSDPHVARLLFLVVTVLRARRFHRVDALPGKRELQLAGIAADHSAALLHVSVVSYLSRPAGSRKEAFRRSCRTASADHR